MKRILVYIFVAVALFSFVAFMTIDTATAHEYNKITQVTNTTINLASDKAIADAMSMSAIDCSTGNDHQVGVSLGSYRNSTSVALGACNRFDNIMLKITGHEKGGTVGLMFTFN